jgi:transposase
MYVARVPNRGSPPAVLLRESYRDGGKVRNRTLANLSRWPEEKVDALARVLKGLPARVELAEAFELTRSLPHGHVAAVLGTARRLGVEQLLDPVPSRSRELVMAMLVAQVIAPGSKLATARGLRAETATSSLGEVLAVTGADEDDLYEAMDWALARQDAIEAALAARHLHDGTLVLYDVSSAAFEGRSCPLGKIGHARDGVRGRLQIVYGLLCTTAGIPVAVDVFEGNTADPKTLTVQIGKLKQKFGLTRVCLVGDRGMLTTARINDELRPAELDWITALRAPQIKALVEQGAIQLSLFDEHDLFQITSPDYPGERLVCCRNPALAEQRTRKREALLAATETELAKIAEATRRERRPLRGTDKITLRLGKVINRYKVGKHLTTEITDEAFSYARDEAKIAAEAALDGIYVIRTSLDEPTLARDDVVLRYKGLEDVERFFRTLNGELDVRPIRHRLADRVRAHVFLRMLSYYITWHMKAALAPLLFTDHDKPAAAATRPSAVAPAQRSYPALRKAARKRTDQHTPVHSFTSLLADLATICANHIQPADHAPSLTLITTLARLPDFGHRPL